MTVCDNQLSSVQERCTSMLVCLIFEPVICLSCISCSKTASLHCEGLWMCTHSNRKGLSMMNLKEPSSCVSGIYTTCSWCHTILAKFGFLFLSWLRWSEKVKLTKVSVLHILFYSVIINRVNKSLDLVTTETNQLVFHVKMSCCGWERKTVNTLFTYIKGMTTFYNTQHFSSVLFRQHHITATVTSGHI